MTGLPGIAQGLAVWLAGRPLQPAVARNAMDVPVGRVPDPLIAAMNAALRETLIDPAEAEAEAQRQEMRDIAHKVAREELIAAGCVPGLVVHARDYGLSPDADWKTNSEALDACIAACRAAGKGAIFLPPGAISIAYFELDSSVTAITAEEPDGSLSPNSSTSPGSTPVPGVVEGASGGARPASVPPETGAGHLLAGGGE